MIADLLIVGCGPMGREHANAARHLGVFPLVVGRRAASAQAFFEATGLQPSSGGIESWLEQTDRVPKAAVVAVDITSLVDVAIRLLRNGVKMLLVEKPGGIDLVSLQRLQAEAQAAAAQVFIAYNRRFLPSVAAARQMIEEDGGLTSFSFEFTELSDRIAELPHPPQVKANWFLANSSHVVDLAFHLGGRPCEMTAVSAGRLEWHPRAVFAGCGLAENGAPFHYGADWSSAGRWGLELSTRYRRIMLRPLEKVQIQRRGEFELREFPLPDNASDGIKPGFLEQMRAFLTPETCSDLLPLETHLDLVEREYLTILSGGDLPK